jgi:hypothetical protein
LSGSRNVLFAGRRICVRRSRRQVRTARTCTRMVSSSSSIRVVRAAPRSADGTVVPSAYRFALLADPVEVRCAYGPRVFSTNDPDGERVECLAANEDVFDPTLIDHRHEAERARHNHAGFGILCVLGCRGRVDPCMSLRGACDGERGREYFGWRGDRAT